jgi:hypothetical protein
VPWRGEACDKPSQAVTTRSRDQREDVVKLLPRPACSLTGPHGPAGPVRACARAVAGSGRRRGGRVGAEVAAARGGERGRQGAPDGDAASIYIYILV